MLSYTSKKAHGSVQPIFPLGGSIFKASAIRSPPRSCEKGLYFPKAVFVSGLEGAAFGDASWTPRFIFFYTCGLASAPFFWLEEIMFRQSNRRKTEKKICFHSKNILFY